MKQTLSDALRDRGYDTLTPVQQAVTSPEHEGRDMLVSAQTGSGKTVGFGLAIAPTVLGDSETFAPADAPLALVIAPTRELALQVKRELSWLFAGAGVRLASCVGGMDMRDERRALARGAHVVVATPGRLRDHIMRGSMEMGALRAVVLDEADEMLDLGFREDLEFILGEAPEERQTLLFSATVPNMITKLAQSYQNDAVRVTVKAAEKQHADISYRAITVNDRDVENAVINTLRFYEAPNAIIFCNTRAMVARMTSRLSNRGFQVVALSGELTQAERSNALQAMRDGRARVCVATDVAARGIDLPKLDLVVHADLPTNQETLLHRSGRTGRAGRKGVSALIVATKAVKKAERLLRWAKLTAEWTGAPTREEVLARDEERMLADPVWSEAVADDETATTLADRFDAKQLAHAYLSLYREKHSAPEEIAPAQQRAPRARADFGPSVWFALEGGRKAGAEPRRLLPMICKAGNLSKEDIGAIRVGPDASYIEISENSVANLEASLGSDMTVEGHGLTQVDSPPEEVMAAPSRSPAGPRGSFRERKSYGDRRPDKRSDHRSGHGSGKPHRKGRPEPREERAVEVTPAKPRKQADAPARKPRAKDTASEGGAVRKKGPPPPKGKANSKKNKARAEAAKAAKGKGGRGKPQGNARGGNEPPRRKRGKYSAD